MDWNLEIYLNMILCDGVLEYLVDEMIIMFTRMLVVYVHVTVISECLLVLVDECLRCNLYAFTYKCVLKTHLIPHTPLLLWKWRGGTTGSDAQSTHVLRTD